MPPPKIRLRGLRSPNVPPGVLLGRLPGGGTGEVQLLNLQQLRLLGVNTKGSGSAAQAAAGFGFTVGGKPTADQLIGIGIWGEAITFATADARDVVTALIPATATATFTIWALNALNVPTQYGTITFAAGVTTATVAWSPNPFALAKGAQLKVYAPADQDATLADISAIVYATS